MNATRPHLPYEETRIREILGDLLLTAEIFVIQEQAADVIHLLDAIFNFK